MKYTSTKKTGLNRQISIFPLSHVFGGNKTGCLKETGPFYYERPVSNKQSVSYRFRDRFYIGNKSGL